MTAASNYLLALAKHNVQVYIANPKAKAAIVTGSVAEGLSDFYSDIDTIIYYEELPKESELEIARQSNQGSERIWVIGDINSGAFGEAYKVNGVKCQFGHESITRFEQDMTDFFEHLDVASYMQKALSGILICIPLHGEELIQKWKAKAANYPNTLAQAMVEKHLQFFPIWGLEENYFAIRDARLWQYQILVETIQNILGVLAGLNKLYYSTFQFKRMGKFINQMSIAPDRLYLRLESIFQVESRFAADQLRELVEETLQLVELHMPQLDTSEVRRKLNWQHYQWKV